MAKISKLTRSITFRTGESNTPNPIDRLSLGFRRDLSRLDLSQYLIHFTKPDGDAGYFNMLKILQEGMLKPGRQPFGCSSSEVQLADFNRAVCFTETPVGFLSRFVNCRSEYGIAFRKSLLIEKGAQPIWYVPVGSSSSEAIRKLTQRGKSIDPSNGRKKNVDTSDPIWQICPFVEITGRLNRTQRQYEWEREWRMLGSLTFSPSDVAFLILPSNLHSKARLHYETQAKKKEGPDYSKCSFVDGALSNEQVAPLHKRLAAKIEELTEALDEYENIARSTGANKGIDQLRKALSEFKCPKRKIIEKIRSGPVCYSYVEIDDLSSGNQPEDAFAGRAIKRLREQISQDSGTL